MLEPIVGSVLDGRYLVDAVAGEGAMGIVYRATHTLIDRRVAVKVLNREFARNPDTAERFIVEARAAAAIRDPHVVDILDFGHTPDGLPFYAMELLEGRDLGAELGNLPAPMAWRRAQRILLETCLAVQSAHDAGVVHRDLKPENIFLVDRNGNPDFVVILDFGIAKITNANDLPRKKTQRGMAFGTPEYMAPEQARGEPVDHRADVYAAGCLLYEVVRGVPPFVGATIADLLHQHVFEPAPTLTLERDPALARALDPIVKRCLAKDPAERFASMRELHDALIAVQPGRPRLAAPRRLWLVAAGAVAAAALVVAVAAREPRAPLALPVSARVVPASIAAPPVSPAPAAKAEAPATAKPQPPPQPRKAARRAAPADEIRPVSDLKDPF